MDYVFFCFGCELITKILNLWTSDIYFSSTARILLPSLVSGWIYTCSLGCQQTTSKNVINTSRSSFLETAIFCLSLFFFFNLVTIEEIAWKRCFNLLWYSGTSRILCSSYCCCGTGSGFHAALTKRFSIKCKYPLLLVGIYSADIIPVILLLRHA